MINIRATIEQYENAVHEFHRKRFVPSYAQVNAIIVMAYKNPPYTEVRLKQTCKHDNSFLNLMAKEQLAKTFNQVIPVPLHEGYNYLCNNDKRIQVASASKGKDGWLFRLKQSNNIDYYMIIAYDSRIDPKPVHTWLIPAKKIAYKQSLFVSRSSVVIWDKYIVPVEVE